MKVYRFDIKTVSEGNARESWRSRHGRRKKQRAAFAILWRNMKCTVEAPATITFTRYSCQLLDSDNLASAFKAIRDSLATEIGIDDGDERVTYKYAQERIAKREHYFTVTID